MINTNSCFKKYCCEPFCQTAKVNYLNLKGVTYPDVEYILFNLHNSPYESLVTKDVYNDDNERKFTVNMNDKMYSKLVEILKQKFVNNKCCKHLNFNKDNKSFSFVYINENEKLCDSLLVGFISIDENTYEFIIVRANPLNFPERRPWINPILEEMYKFFQIDINSFPENDLVPYLITQEERNETLITKINDFCSIFYEIFFPNNDNLSVNEMMMCLESIESLIDYCKKHEINIKNNDIRNEFKKITKIFIACCYYLTQNIFCVIKKITKLINWFFDNDTYFVDILIHNRKDIYIKLFEKLFGESLDSEYDIANNTAFKVRMLQINIAELLVKIFGFINTPGSADFLNIRIDTYHLYKKQENLGYDVYKDKFMRYLVVLHNMLC